MKVLNIDDDTLKALRNALVAAIEQDVPDEIAVLSIVATYVSITIGEAVQVEASGMTMFCHVEENTTGDDTEPVTMVKEGVKRI